MIIYIVKLFILIYLFYMIRKVYDMLQYNTNASLIHIDPPNKDKIELEIKTKCPLLISHPTNQLGLTIETMNHRIPGYIIRDGDTLLSLDQLHKSDIISVYKNFKLVDDYQLKDHASTIELLFSSYMTCGSDYYLSLYRGDHTSILTKNYRESLVLQSLYGSLIIYLFNPKHEKDIKGLDPKSIKKWGIRVELTQDNLLYIPSEWYYFYELTKEVILLQIESDSYSTFLFNYLRKK